MIHLKHSSIERTAEGCITRFADGTHVLSVPHPEDHHYYVIAHRCGYGDDIHAYCYEHDFVHLFLAEELFDAPSPGLWGVAHGNELSASEAAIEECGVHIFQRWLRANEEPIIGRIDWHAMKARALELLAAHVIG